MKIAVCAGHGGSGSTPGKRSPDGEYEWNFNNKVVCAFIDALNQYENVQILRTDDATGHTDVPLKTRTDKANAWGADVYLSFHHNANTGSWGTWTGTETFTYLGSQPKSEQLAQQVHSRILGAYGLANRGLKKEDFHIVRETKMPAILVEGGYMDSTIDIKKLRDNNVLRAAGIAAAEGVAAYGGLKKKAVAQPTPAPTPTSLYRVRKSWEDAKSQIGAFANLDGARAVVDQNPGYHAYDNDGKQVYPAVATEPAPATHMYRVRKSWDDAKSQIGAYGNIDNARACADANPGYTVFDETGKAVYTKPAETVQPAPTPTPAPAPTPTPAPVVEDHTGHHPIVAKSAAVAEQMVAFVKAVNPVFDEAIAPAFLAVGNKYGIAGDIAFCQSIIETGYFKFDGGTAVTPDQHNYAGIGVTSKGMKGNSFDTIEQGVTAQIQHLYAYATKGALPDGETSYDPRFQYVTRGIAPHWEDLNNHWAMNTHYGQDIMALYQKLLATPVPAPVVEQPTPVVEQPAPTPVEETPVAPSQPTDNPEEKINIGLLNRVLQAIFDFLKGLLGK